MGRTWQVGKQTWFKKTWQVDMQAEQDRQQAVAVADVKAGSSEVSRTTTRTRQGGLFGPADRLIVLYCSMYVLYV